MASYGAYYYARSDKPGAAGAADPRPITARRPDAPGVDDVRSPAPGRARSPMPGYKMRSNSPSEGERPISRFGARLEERAATSYGERPMTSYIPPQGAHVFFPEDDYYQRPQTVFRPQTAAPYPHNTPPMARPPERTRRPESPDPSIVSDFSDTEVVRPTQVNVDITTYAKCLERAISDPNLSTPLRLGLMGAWSDDKTRFIQGILWCVRQACNFNCHNLDEPIEPARARWIKKTCSGLCDMSYFAYLLLLFLLYMAITAGTAVFAVLAIYIPLRDESANSTTAVYEAASPELIVAMSVLGVVLAVMLIAGLVLCCKDRYLRGIGTMLAHMRMFIIMALCDTPTPPGDTGEKVEMIPVCFHASFIQADDISSVWGPMLELISQRLETFFGVYKSRFYRACNKDVLHLHDSMVADDDRWAQRSNQAPKPHPYHSPLMNTKMGRTNGSLKTKHSPTPIRHQTTQNGSYGYKTKHPQPYVHTNKQERVVGSSDLDDDEKPSVSVHSSKWKCIPYPILISMLLSLASMSIIILTVCTISLYISTEDHIYLYVLIGVSSAIILIVILTQIKPFILLLDALCHSQSTRIHRLAKKTRKITTPSYQDLVHRKVMGEVGLMMGFIRQMEHIYQRRFRLLLVVDDLDKCENRTLKATLETVQKFLSDTNYPLVSLLNMETESVINRLEEAGHDSPRLYLDRMMDMKFCMPAISLQDMGKMLDQQADHMVCSTQITVNRLKEQLDSKYEPSNHKDSRRHALSSMDKQFDLEEAPVYQRTPSAYFHHPLSARAIHTATGKRTKSGRSKKRVVFTPIRSTSEDGILEGPEDTDSNHGPPPDTPLPTDRRPTLPAVEQAASPIEARRNIATPAERERPDSVLSRVRSPPSGTRLRREGSTVTEASSEEEDNLDDPDWMLAMSCGESRKESKMSIRRAAVTADSEKTPDQIKAQYASALAEIKQVLGVSSNNLLTVFVEAPKFSVSVDHASGAPSVSLLPSSFNIGSLSADQIKRHVLSFGLRRRLMNIAMDEVRANFKVFEASPNKLTQVFNSVFLSVYIWVQKLKQLSIVDVLLQEKECERALVKLYQTSQELTRWVILCELWPYRCSWLAYKVERINRKMGDFPSSNFYLESSIKDIYKDIKQDMSSCREDLYFWTEFDHSTTTFKKTLERFKDMSGQSVLRYLPFTPNLDRVIRHEIRSRMSNSDQKQDFDDTPDSPTQKTISFADTKQEIPS